MDRKSIAILILSIALLISYPFIERKLSPPPPPQPAASTNTSASTVADGTNAVLKASSDVASAPVVAKPTVKEELVTLDTPEARYTFTSHGGGLKLIELKKYPAAPAKGAKMEANGKDFSQLNARALEPSLALLGGETLQGDNVFHLTQLTNAVRAEKLLANGLSLVKEFQIGSNYLVTVNTRLENRSAQPLSLPAQEWVIGTASWSGGQDETRNLGAVWYDGTSDTHIEESWFANRMLGCFPGTPRSVYEAGDANVNWAAVHNQFFTLVAIPKDKADKVVSRHVTFTATPEEEANPRAPHPTYGFQTALVYPAKTLAPKQVVEHQITLYAGPKEYNTLAKLGEQFGNRLDLAMNFGGFIGWFAKALLLSMTTLHAWGMGYGWTIVAITVIIKLIFWPLTTASTRSMKRMQALQPQMNALKEKYKDDPQKQNTKLMEFMRENRVNPMAGCIPMVVQVPVFLGFFRMLQTAIELRGSSFLWIHDLSMPDTIGMLPGLNFPINLMPLIMGATMFWQAQLTPPSPGVDPVQQKMMKYMPMMFLVFLYNFSAGLTVYWTVQNLLTITQLKLTRMKDPVPAVAVSAAKKK